jgi:hypothetical protein
MEDSMSHKSTTKIDLFDEDALLGALDEVGVRYNRNATWHGYRSQQVTECSAVIPKYESNSLWGYGDIGFKVEGGKLTIIADGMDLNTPPYKSLLARFRKAYTERAAANLLAKEYGYRVERQADGTYRATATMKTAQVLMTSRGSTRTSRTATVGR